MVKAASLFSQLLHHFPRTDFQCLVFRHRAEYRAKGFYFVTRQKDNAVFKVIEEREIPRKHNILSDLLSDQIIELTGVGARKKCPHPLRRVVVWDPVKKRQIILLTNHMNFGATTIAAIYKDRWQIEIFFKTLKQHLKIKTFVGTSENALRLQIWTALIALMLLKYLHHLSRAKWSISNLASMVRLNLFTYRNLKEWLDDPFNKPPLLPNLLSQPALPGLGQAMGL